MCQVIAGGTCFPVWKNVLYSYLVDIDSHIQRVTSSPFTFPYLTVCYVIL